MKTINVTFTDEEHERLVKEKGGLNWHDFILQFEDMVSLIHFYEEHIDSNDPAWGEVQDSLMEANNVYHIYRRVFKLEESD